MGTHFDQLLLELDSTKMIFTPSFLFSLHSFSSHPDVDAFEESGNSFDGILAIGSWNPTRGRKSVEFWSSAGSGDRCKLDPTLEPTLEPTTTTKTTTTTTTKTTTTTTPDASCVY